jgi:hypothetical protein
MPCGSACPTRSALADDVDEEDHKPRQCVARLSLSRECAPAAPPLRHTLSPSPCLSRSECGVFAAFLTEAPAGAKGAAGAGKEAVKKSASRTTFFALYALNHRACGVK